MDAQIQGQDTEYKPWGLTAGAMVGTRQADTDAANTLAIQGSQLGNVVKQKDAMVAQGQMDDPEWLKQKLAGERGQGKSLAATGEFDEKTLNSKIQEGIAKNIQGKSAAEVGDQLNKASVLSNNLQKIFAAGEQMGFDGLEFQTQAQAIAQEAGLPPASVAKFMQMPPDKRAEFLKGQIKLMDLVRTNTSAVLQKNAETTHAEQAKLPGTAMTVAGHDRVAQGNNATSIQVANINAQSRLDAAKLKGKATDIIAQAQAGKLTYEKAATAFEMMASLTDDPIEAAKYKDLASKFDIANQKSRAAGRQVPVDLSAVGVQTQQVTPTLGSSGNTGKTKSGVKYTVVPK